MKVVGFIGGYDKTELILQIARILTLANKKVIVIDATITQKTKYVIPTISEEKSYITEFEDFDVAIGFSDMESIKQYLGTFDYDVAIVDVDTEQMAKTFEVENNYKNCFVTGFDLYSLKKGIEILNSLETSVTLIKVLFSKDFSKQESEYLDYLTLGAKTIWDENTFNFPIEVGNYSVMLENQTISRIKMKKLSNHYKTSLIYLVSMIFKGEISELEVKKIMRSMERI